MTYRPDLKKIERSYNDVLKNWELIDAELDNRMIGRKDTPFDALLMENMLTAWDYIDYLLHKKDIDLISVRGWPHMIEVNNRVHYGENQELRQEYKKAIEATTEKFTTLIGPIEKYYRKNIRDHASIYKVAAEVFISILGMPQLFVEGNHRSGSVIAGWINLAYKKPPFILTVDNAVAFFAPAQEIKKFNKHSVWRSMTKLPKYKKDFKIFWKQHCDMEFVRK